MGQDKADAVLAAVMAELVAGRTLNSITMGRGGHGPLIVRLYKLRPLMAADPEWSARAQPLIERNGKAARFNAVEWKRKITHCPRGHDYNVHGRRSYKGRYCAVCNLITSREPKKHVEREVIVKIAEDLKSGVPIGRITKPNTPDFRVTHVTFTHLRKTYAVLGNLIAKRTADREALLRDQVRLVLEGLNHEMTLHQLTSRETPRYLPAAQPVMGATQLLNFMTANPALGKRMKAQSAKNAAKNLAAVGLSRRSTTSTALLRNDGHDAYDAVQRATGHIWEGERGEVQSLMFIAIGDKRLTLRGCTREVANCFLKESKRRPRVFGDSYKSLDAPLYDESGMTRMDKITRMLWRDGG
jgi:hypothetical protein